MGRNVIILLSLLAITTSGYTQQIRIPPPEVIREVMRDKPEIIVEMIQKLYILEQAIPMISFPEIEIIELIDGTARVAYMDNLYMLIGTEKANLKYSVELTPINVTIARIPCPETPWGLIIGGGTAALVVGVVGGVVIGHLLSK